MSVPREPEQSNENVDPFSGKTVLILNYSHMDWAWCFTRQWHEARYVRIFDEANDVMEADPDFCFFIDSLAESVEPYFQQRPAARETWNRFAREGRLAVVGGHYANIRPATAPEELYIRNLEIGRDVLHALLPDANPIGLANLDTAIGHSQLPQVLSLAGLTYMLAGRPEVGLSRDGIPKVFRWEGTDGSTLLTLVQHYGILGGHLARLASADASARMEARDRARQLLEPQAEGPVDTLYALLSHDDGRYLRGQRVDEAIDIHRAIAEWNAGKSSTMVMGTPDGLYRKLMAQADRLPLIRGAIDQADVGYNGPFGQQGLRALRDRTAASLVEAEVYCVLRRLSGHADGTPSLSNAWRDALRAQSHAMQALFSDDIEAVERDLRHALATADGGRERAMNGLAPSCLPQDSHTVAVFNPLPRARRCVVPIPICRTDFSVPGYRLRDPAGNPIPQQPLCPANPGRPGEWQVLAELDLPACGVRTLMLEEANEVPSPVRSDVPLDGCTKAGSSRLEWHDGLLTRIEQKAGALTANADASLLEPMFRPATIQGWMTASIAEPDSRLRVRSLCQTENGPLRWCVERDAVLGPHEIFQRFMVWEHGLVEVETEVAYGPDDGYFTLALPCAQGTVLLASIPFGVEPRTPGDVRYSAHESGDRVIERLVPGLFYARDWVRVHGTPAPAAALVVVDGDRYWLRPPGVDRLEHLLLRVSRPQHEGWVQRTRLNRPGWQRFRHVLALGDRATPDILSSIADECRFPVRCRPTPDLQDDDGHASLLAVDCDHVRLLACRMVGGDIEVRLVESSGQPASVSIAFAQAPVGPRLIDLCGNILPAAVQQSGQTVTFDIAPWQICTLRTATSGAL